MKLDTAFDQWLCVTRQLALGELLTTIVAWRDFILNLRCRAVSQVFWLSDVSGQYACWSS